MLALLEEEEPAPEMPGPLNTYYMLKKYNLTILGSNALAHTPYIHLMERNTCANIEAEYEARFRQDSISDLLSKG